MPCSYLALAATCPDCPVSREARALVFSEPFWINTWYALLPFVLVGFLVHRIVRRLDQGTADHEP